MTHAYTPHPKQPSPSRKPEPKPLPRPEGGKRHAVDPDELNPRKRRDYHDSDGDAADPQRTGPGT